MARFNPNKAQELKGGCLSLFGLPFLVAGLFICWLYFSGYADWWRARGWVEVPCQIGQTELKESRGDDSTSYRTIASYQYEYGGRSYQGEQVSFGKGSDNIGEFQRRAHRELSSHARSGKPFRCFVNPTKPEESVIYRSLRWQMQLFMSLFALTFPAVGAGLVVFGLIAGREMKREEALRLAHPDEPWRWKPAWSGTSIPEKHRNGRKVLFLYTLWAGVVIVPLVFATAAGDAFKTDKWAWLVFIPTALWVFPAWFSLRQWRQTRIIGKAVFEPAETPARTGGNLSGNFLLEKSLPLRLDAVAELSCEKKTTSASSDGDSTSSEKIWTQHIAIPQDRMTRDISGFRLPVSFGLPIDAPPGGESDNTAVKHEWKLRLTVPGTPISAEFEVPVFRGEHASGPDMPGGDAPSFHSAAEVELPVALAARGIQATFDEGGLPSSIVCPARRNPQMIVFLVIFNLIWTGVAVLIFIKDAPLIFKIVWPLTAAGTWYAVLWSLLHRREVSFRPDAMEVTNKLGPSNRTTTLPKISIKGFSHDTHMTSGNQSFYRVFATDASGKKHSLVDGITESLTVAALVKRLEAWKAAQNG